MSGSAADGARCPLDGSGGCPAELSACGGRLGDLKAGEKIARVLHTPDGRVTRVPKVLLSVTELRKRGWSFARVDNADDGRIREIAEMISSVRDGRHLFAGIAVITVRQLKDIRVEKSRNLFCCIGDGGEPGAGYEEHVSVETSSTCEQVLDYMRDCLIDAMRVEVRGVGR